MGALARAVLAVLVIAALTPATAAAEAAFGRWTGVGPGREHVAFVVRSYQGYRVIGSPSFACPVTPLLGSTYGGYSLGSLDDDVLSSSGRMPSAVVAPIRPSGWFGYPDVYYVHNAALSRTLRDNDMFGRLGTDAGRVKIPGWESPCESDWIRVKHVSDDVKGDGLYVGFGSYLTQIGLQVRSGGSLISFLQQGGQQSTQWGGPPDPRITEELGPAAGLEACVYGPGPGNVPVPGNAMFVVGGLFEPESVEPAELTVGGKFIGDASLAGIYGGYFTLDAETNCPLNGAWAAHRVSSPPATRWPTGFRPSGADRPTCRLVHKIVTIHLDPNSVPQIIQHIKTATTVQHWPRILIVNRPDADRRRNRLLRTVKSRPGQDRDEYPPAILRGRGDGLERGQNPTGWMASVAYVAPRQNQSAGATTSARVAPYCNGQPVEYTW